MSIYSTSLFWIAFVANLQMMVVWSKLPWSKDIKLKLEGITLFSICLTATSNGCCLWRNISIIGSVTLWYCYKSTDIDGLRKYPLSINLWLSTAFNLIMKFYLNSLSRWVWGFQSCMEQIVLDRPINPISYQHQLELHSFITLIDSILQKSESHCGFNNAVCRRNFVSSKSSQKYCNI